MFCSGSIANASAILKASGEERLKPRGGEAIRAAVLEAVRDQYIVLVEDEMDMSREALPFNARTHIAGLNPTAFHHFTLASHGRFSHFVTCDAKEASMSQDWGLRSISPSGPTLEMELCRERIYRWQLLLSSLGNSVEDLRLELDDANSDIKAVGNDDLKKAVENLSIELAEVDIHALEELLDAVEKTIE